MVEVKISIKKDVLFAGKKLKFGGEVFGTPPNLYECPSCGNDLIRYHNMNYCFDCGVKIKWVE